MRFWQADPKLEHYWRGVIFFGNNLVTYLQSGYLIDIS